jgi:Telomere resolvase
VTRQWLEERLATLLPALDRLGCEQEEEIRRLCEAEKEAWHQRPGLKAASSFNVPMVQTRNRIREELFLKEENWWINPKSGVKEHIALKYMNFSTEEWTRITLPRGEVLQERRIQPLVLSDADLLVRRGEKLLGMTTWPELVVGLMLTTGRTLAEILKTGVFRHKTAYSVALSVPMTVYEQRTPFFEVPTLVRADQVCNALDRVRDLFDLQFAFTDRRSIGRQCHPLVRQAAFEYFGDVVPLRPGEQDLYTFFRVGCSALDLK